MERFCAMFFLLLLQERLYTVGSPQFFLSQASSFSVIESRTPVFVLVVVYARVAAWSGDRKRKRSGKRAGAREEERKGAGGIEKEKSARRSVEASWCLASECWTAGANSSSSLLAWWCQSKSSFSFLDNVLSNFSSSLLDNVHHTSLLSEKRHDF